MPIIDAYLLLCHMKPVSLLCAVCVCESVPTAVFRDWWPVAQGCFVMAAGSWQQAHTRLTNHPLS